MKKVNVMYFRPSGKFYTEEDVEISEQLSGYEALFEELPKHHRIKEMVMVVNDSDDGKLPYIVPHMYQPTEN